MPVYLIRAGECGPVKIGYAADPQSRLYELQVAHYEKLHLLRMWHGHVAEERMLHARFSDQHIRGEWFHFTKIMLGDLGLPEIQAQAPVIVDLSSHTVGTLVADADDFGSIVRAARKSRSVSQEETAKQLGIARSTLASIEAGHDLPGRDLLVRIADLFQVSPDFRRPN